MTWCLCHRIVSASGLCGFKRGASGSQLNKKKPGANPAFHFIYFEKNYPNFSNTSITSLTALRLDSISAFSSLFKSSSMIFSTPFLPNTTGTPR